LLAFGGAAVSIFRSTTGLAWGIGGGAVVGLLLVVVPRLHAMSRRRRSTTRQTAVQRINGASPSAAEHAATTSVSVHAVVPGLSHPTPEALNPPVSEPVTAPPSVPPADDGRRAI
jgi:hypothetical protein